METFVTIWSKSSYSGVTLWVIERTHTVDYIAVTIGIRSMDEVVLISGRYYAIFDLNVNPNDKELRDSLTDKICAARGFAMITGSNPVPSANSKRNV